MNRTMEWKAMFAGILLGFALVIGCKTTGDPFVLNVERVETIALPTFKQYVHWERVNKPGGDAHKIAEEIRSHGLDYLTDLDATKKAYKANRTPENKASVEAAFAALNEALAKATEELIKRGVK